MSSVDPVTINRQALLCEMKDMPMAVVSNLTSKMKIYETLPPEEKADLAQFLYWGAMSKAEKQTVVDTWESCKTANAFLYLACDSFLKCDEAKGLNYLKKSAKLGNKTAMLRVGLCYSMGVGAEPDPKRAYDIFEKLAREEKDPIALYFCGSMIAYGKYPFISLPAERGKKMLEYSLNSGCKYAEFEHGVILLKKAKTPEEKQKGYEWMRRAAEHREPRAMLTYAVAMQNGEVSPSDSKLIKKYFDTCILLAFEPAVEAFKKAVQDL